MSARLQLDTATTLDEVGLIGQRGDSLGKPLGYGVTLTRQQMTNVARTTRTPVDAIDATLLRTYANSAIDFTGYNIQDAQSLRRLAAREWAHFNHSNLCVGCHHDNGAAWRLTWKLPWHAVCLEHDSLLTHLCPGCEQPFMLAATNGIYGPPMSSHVPDAGACNNGLPTGQAQRGRTAKRCGYRFDNIHPTRLDDPRIHAAQDVYMDALEAGTRSKTWWTDARRLTAVVLRLADTAFFNQVLPDPPPPVARAIIDHYDRLRDKSYIREDYDDPRTGPRSRILSQTPRNPALMSATLPVTQPILDAVHGYTDSTEAQQMLRALYRAVRASGAHETLHAALRNRGSSDALVQAAAAHSPRAAFTRIAPTTGETTDEINADNIPQLWWPGRYEQIRHAFEDSETTDTYARRFVSLAAVHILQRCTWRQAAEALGWRNPESSASHKSHAQSRLRTSGTLDAVTSHIDATLAELRAKAAENPDSVTNYRKRRELWADQDAIHPDDWRAVTDTIPTSRELRAAAAWRWEHVGLNYIEEYPVFLREAPGLDDIDDDDSERQRYHAFADNLELEPDLATRLYERLTMNVRTHRPR